MQHEVREYELTGGARLLAICIPNTITFFWTSVFRAGYRYLPTNRYELPHLAEHLAFEGTKTYPDSLAFKVEVEQDGTYYNATTDFDHVAYIYSGSREELGRIVPINLSQIYEPLYRAEHVKQEQRVIEQEMSRRREDDGWRLGYMAMHRLLPQCNPDIDERIGNIGAITRKELLAYHERYYGAANTAFVLAGDYSPGEIEEVAAVVNKRLEGHATGERHTPKRLKFGAQGGEVAAYAPFSKDQSLFGLQFARPGRDDADFPVLVIISALLTGGLSARLQRKARQQGLTYGISASANTHHDFTALSIRSQTSLDKLMPLVELAAGELAAVGAGDFTDEELGRAIGSTVGRLRRSHQTPAAYADWYADQFVMGEPLESPEQRVKRLETVDRAAIARVFHSYIRHDQGLLTLIGEGLDRQTAKFEALLRNHFS